MDILILEDEIYLAQKVASRLQDEGYNSTHFATYKEVDPNIHYDTILLSTNIPIGNTEEIIKKYPNSIIILLVAYINDATVTKPLQAGAKDYVSKPFSVDELIRKIKHYQEFEMLQHKNESLSTYFDFIFDNITYNQPIPKTLPFIIETNDQKLADKIVLDYAKKINKKIQFISLKQNHKIDFSKYKDKLIYIYDIHNLKNTSKDILLKSLEGLNVIFCSLEVEGDLPFEKVIIKNDKLITANDTILTINDYVKMMVLKFQDKYPDTELSKKLGISRKSLWEKRKKFNMQKSKR